MPRLAELLVVAHTHWDREWYHTAERFRQRLVALVDELLDDPPAEGASFLLDGQAVILDDYLAVRPERAAELSVLLREGRLEAGPWYVLADELIPSGEALVRNLLAGRDAVRRLRGTPPPVLYCPDSFGHPAILPELASGFGCTLIVAWRGYGGARWPAGDTVRWRGPTGAEVLLHHLPPDGYEYGSALPLTEPEAAERWRRLAGIMGPRATTGVALLLNGADHHALQREQRRAVQLLARAAAPVTVRPSSLAAAAAAILHGSGAAPLPLIEGELRDSYGYTWTLGGTLATRAAQKRRNAECERMLVRDVEPWIALQRAGGDAGTRALLRAAWRDLLHAHPHDTLCGTSIDAVALAMDQRLASVMQQAYGLHTSAVQSLLAHDVERARLQPDAWRPALVLRNPVARRRAGVAEVTIVSKIADVAVGPGSGSRQGAPVEPDDDVLSRAGIQVVSRRRLVALTESPRAYPDADLVEEVRGVRWVDDIAGYSIEAHLLDALRADPAPGEVRVSAGLLDNGLLRVTVDDAGVVQLADLVAGHAIADVLHFEQERDVGDLYTPAIRESLGEIPYSHCETTRHGPLRGELSLRFTDGTGQSTVVARLQLDAGLPALRILIEGHNALDDVRVRMRCETGAGPHATTFADAAFHPVTRATLAIRGRDAAIEHVVATAPLHRWVTRFGAPRSATLVSDGLAEYEALAEGGIAVTLLRAVGELSRATLPERPGHAGWPAPTPLAQSHGEYAACFALAPHGPDSPAQRDAIERLADDILLPITGETLRSNLEDERTRGGIELHGSGLAFSAAMPATQPGWVVLRCANRRDEPVQGRWKLAPPVHGARLARLDESPGEPLRVDAEGIHFDAASGEIVTVLARVG